MCELFKLYTALNKITSPKKRVCKLKKKRNRCKLLYQKYELKILIQLKRSAFYIC